MTIAWNHLSDIAQAQLLHFRPELQFQADMATGAIPRCPTPYCGGWLMEDDGELKCMLCERVFDKNGEEIRPVPGELVVMHTGTGFHKGGK